MVKQFNRGWLGIYLFYGTIFFLLGLMGYGVSSRTITGYLRRYAVNAGRYMQNIKEYSLAKDFGFEDGDGAIAVNASQYTQKVLFVYSLELWKNHPELVKEIRSKIRARVNNAAIVGVSHDNWGKRLENLFAQYEFGEENALLIGFDFLETTNQGGSYQVTLIMPKFLATTLASRILLSFTELYPEIRFEDHVVMMGRALNFSWDEERKNPGASNPSTGPVQAMDLVIEILQQNFSGGVKI